MLCADTIPATDEFIPRFNYISLCWCDKLPFLLVEVCLCCFSLSLFRALSLSLSFSHSSFAIPISIETLFPLYNKFRWVIESGWRKNLQFVLEEGEWKSIQKFSLFRFFLVVFECVRNVVLRSSSRIKLKSGLQKNMQSIYIQTGNEHINIAFFMDSFYGSGKIESKLCIESRCFVLDVYALLKSKPFK